MFGTFFEVLKLFKCLFGASLSLSCSFWRCLGNLQDSKSIVLHWEIRLLKMLYSVRWGSGFPSRAHLSAPYAVATPNWHPKWTQNKFQNHTKKCSKFGPTCKSQNQHVFSKCWGHFGPKQPTNEKACNPPMDPRGQQNVQKTWNCRQNQTLASRASKIFSNNNTKPLKNVQLSFK